MFYLGREHSAEGAEGVLQRTQAWCDAAQSSWAVAAPPELLQDTQTHCPQQHTLKTPKHCYQSKEKQELKALEMANQERLSLCFYFQGFFPFAEEQESHFLTQDVLIHIFLLTSPSQAHQNTPGERSATALGEAARKNKAHPTLRTC